VTNETTTVGVIGMGDMGSAVGGALVRAGYAVLTPGEGGSDTSRESAKRAGVEDVHSLAALVERASLVLSIVPPAAAASVAADVMAALETTGARPVFAECNAVSPATMRGIAARVESAGIPCVDVGIVGRGPRVGGERTRFYVSGQDRASVLGLVVPDIELIDMGREIGTASALKMTYAALNKGIDALHATILLAAERLGVRDALMRELEGSQAEALRRMRSRVPFLAATAERFAPEMAEIAETFAAAGVSPDFHRGAEWLYALLATTPLASETRATLPSERSLDAALEVFAAALDDAPPAQR
jgi:3-hydroxyisobutyrate dehydrogenase-like beta-hydroxyacid dehydrogenase